MVNRYQLFAGIPEISQSLDQFCRIHFEFRCGLSNIRHGYEAAAGQRRLDSGNQTTSLFWVRRFRMLDDLIEDAG